MDALAKWKGPTATSQDFGGLGMEFKIRCSEIEGAEIRRRAKELGSSLNFYFLASALGKITVKKFKGPQEPSPEQVLRGQSKAVKHYWNIIKNWLEEYRTRLYVGDEDGFMEDFQDLIAEANKLVKEGSEAGLQEFINSGKLRARRDEVLACRLQNPDSIPLEASSVFDRIAGGKLR